MKNRDESAFGEFAKDGDVEYRVGGFTKREYAAIKFMERLVAMGDTSPTPVMAEMAVLYADSLFEELEK